VRNRFAAASTLIDLGWFERAMKQDHRTGQVAMLEILGQQLRSEAGLMVGATDSPYLRVKVEDAQTWMPWEYLLFDAALHLRTPLLYWVPTAQHARRPWHLNRILFVHETNTTSWEPELDAIRKTVTPMTLNDEIAVDHCDLDAFLENQDARHADVLHFAMHGPDDPAVAFDAKVRTRLLKAIHGATPNVIVLNACNGIYMLLNNGVRRYPAAPLKELFNDGADTIVTTHFLLEDQEMPSIWSRTFYLALVLTGDAAIAAAWARGEVGDVMQSLCELATIVVARRNSLLAATEIA
jgi:hypothetical protein